MKKIRMRLCDIETAKALQELGYDGEYQHCYVNISDDGYETLTIAECKEYESDIDNQCPAPRLDDVAYWLRDKYLLDIDISRIIVLKGEPSYEWDYYIKDYANLTDIDYYHCGANYPTYEDALDAADKECIKIIKQCK